MSCGPTTSAVTVAVRCDVLPLQGDYWQALDREFYEGREAGWASGTPEQEGTQVKERVCGRLVGRGWSASPQAPLVMARACMCCASTSKR